MMSHFEKPVFKPTRYFIERDVPSFFCGLKTTRGSKTNENSGTRCFWCRPKVPQDGPLPVINRVMGPL